MALIEDVISQIRPEDTLTVPLATGQPMDLLHALAQRSDWKRLEIFCGLLTAPYEILKNPNVFVTSGYYGPVERGFNARGTHVQYLPSNLRGFEYRERRNPSRVVATVLSEPDGDGYCTFGTHAAATANPFIEAARDPARVAIGEIHAAMPRVYGVPELGDNKIHINEIDFTYIANYAQPTSPIREPSEAERLMASQVVNLIPDCSTLQFGIGPVPDLVASTLAAGDRGDFGIHSEMISDGVMKLIQTGKVSNAHKIDWKGQTIFSFAFGSETFYRFLDNDTGGHDGLVRSLPATTVNNPHVMARIPRFVSMNSGLMVDFAGQVCSEAIGSQQYSGVGGQLSFVQGAGMSDGGVSILCIKSSAMVDGTRVSNIRSVLPAGSLVSTPRHFTQTIVTEYGVANLQDVGDEHRGEHLIKIAHPDFRAELSEEFQRMKAAFYKN